MKNGNVIDQKTKMHRMYVYVTICDMGDGLQLYTVCIVMCVGIGFDTTVNNTDIEFRFFLDFPTAATMQQQEQRAQLCQSPFLPTRMKSPILFFLLYFEKLTNRAR